MNVGRGPGFNGPPERFPGPAHGGPSGSGGPMMGRDPRDDPRMGPRSDMREDPRGPRGDPRDPRGQRPPQQMAPKPVSRASRRKLIGFFLYFFFKFPLDFQGGPGPAGAAGVPAAQDQEKVRS